MSLMRWFLAMAVAAPAAGCFGTICEQQHDWRVSGTVSSGQPPTPVSGLAVICTFKDRTGQTNVVFDITGQRERFTSDAGCQDETGLHHVPCTPGQYLCAYSYLTDATPASVVEEVQHVDIEFRDPRMLFDAGFSGFLAADEEGFQRDAFEPLLGVTPFDADGGAVPLVPTHTGGVDIGNSRPVTMDVQL